MASIFQIMETWQKKIMCTLTEAINFEEGKKKRKMDVENKLLYLRPSHFPWKFLPSAWSSDTLVTFSLLPVFPFTVPNVNHPKLLRGPEQRLKGALGCQVTLSHQGAMDIHHNDFPLRRTQQNLIKEEGNRERERGGGGRRYNYSCLVPFSFYF